ncbi:2-iminoacetate synthase ThiH [Ichthyobacterium seriolicida]|uniref:Thiazole biosynthesis protein thiH n=1 Tax=Ichthyobacterium seriolicida TaxID=242600 RepID=A0A1J1E4I0_9FLAO|nr:2-iminoacetate synthase ThiH [Ichthyobacterium seriolicida]BAV94956.1 thiazole biosynthesis protein thiH [Ichthyobacterium seriolicida]
MIKNFKDIFDTYEFQDIEKSIYSKTEKDVEIALTKKSLDLEDFKALVSPSAKVYLKTMIEMSNRFTKERFGNTIQMYIPMYLSNECQNICTYCGFSMNVNIERKTLSEAEIIEEISMIKKMGYQHIVLLTGESNRTVGMEYFRRVIPLVKSHFSNISMEVQPLKEVEYRELIDLGVNTILIYQETYNRSRYKSHHPKGRKSNFDYRLETCDRLGRAGIHKIGLGVLIGLEDWRTDSFLCAMHLQYLERVYWKTRYSISFPRLKPCASQIPIKSVISEGELIQLICAYRIFNREVELSISTRERAAFRDVLIKTGITSASAESKTNPGGYSKGKEDSLEQFSISDHRSTDKFTEMIREQGYEPVFKDWDSVLQIN